MRKLLLLIWLTAANICLAQTLPRVYLTYDTLRTDSFQAGSMLLAHEGDTVRLPMQIRHRGAFSLRFEKPSYAIRLTDSIGQKTDTALLGMRKDNYWILDAMAGDLGRFRNRASMDLWLQMARQPWYKSQQKKLVNGYRGQMVELYLDSLPQGIYCLMERVDRKQLRLHKYDADSLGVRSTLYKSVRADRTGFAFRPWYYPTEQTHVYDYQWEQKYPDWEDGQPICWTPLYNFFVFIWNADSTTFADGIASRLDLPVWMDYELFCMLLSAWDNTAKNLYLSFYNMQADNRALVTPWDIDHSLGRRYDTQPEDPTTVLFSGNRLSVRLRAHYPHYVDSLEARYATLRQSYFSREHLDSLIHGYFDLYAATGMDTVEQNLWHGHNGLYINFAYERTYVDWWLTQRLSFLDSLYHYSPSAEPPLPTSAADILQHNQPRKLLLNGQLYILKGDEQYDILGRKIR